MHSTRKKEFRKLLAKWREVFAMDFRSLALFRILLGMMLLADLLFRLPVLRAMYSDEGVMTREMVFRYYQSFIGNNWEYGVWSLYWISGDLGFQYFLFCISAVAATALIFGWKTRIATIVSWVLLASLHARNPLILTSGDTILKLSLFWSMFLPLGRIWSLDSRTIQWGKTKDGNGKRFYSLATVAYIWQIILMYFFTGVAKCNPDWFSGDAMEYVLRLDIYILPLGHWLLKFPILLIVVTYATLFLEVVGIWYLLYWKRNELARLIVMMAYWGFHIGIGLTMAIGLFPLICLTIWIPLLPSCVWKWLSRQKSTTRGLEIVRNPNSRFHLVCNTIIVISIVFVTLLNISNINNPICRRFLPQAFAPIGCWLNLDQRFQMFGQPPKSNPWFVYEATLRDGTQVDLFRSEMFGKVVLVDHQRPQSVLNSVPNHHWRKLHRNLVHPLRAEFRQALVDYAVRGWDEKHEGERRVARVSLTCYSEAIGPDYDGIALESIVWGSYEDPEHAAGSKFDAAVDDLLDGLPF